MFNGLELAYSLKLLAISTEQTKSLDYVLRSPAQLLRKICSTKGQFVVKNCVIYLNARLFPLQWEKEKKGS